EHGARQWTARSLRPADVLAALPEIWRAWASPQPPGGGPPVLAVLEPPETAWARRGERSAWAQAESSTACAPFSRASEPRGAGWVTTARSSASGRAPSRSASTSPSKACTSAPTGSRSARSGGARRPPPCPIWRPRAPVRGRFVRPERRIAAGAWLARHGARAMIDVSDGLAADAGHLAAASGVRVEIALERIPRWPGATARAAAQSGEEYELLVALPRRFDERAARAFRRATGLHLTRIGACTRGGGVRITDNGRPITPLSGFDHFPAR